MPAKPKPKPLWVTQRAINEERVNVVKRTEKRIRELLAASEDSTNTEQVSVEREYSVDKATQTEIPMREVHVEIKNWHTCLNAFCFCLLLLCMNLLYFQWLYTNTKLNRV